MGTRSLTFVYDENRPVINMYRQFDGYVSGHGRDLAEFLMTGKMTNGIPVGSKEHFFNGMGCLAAQLVANFKKDAGGIYLYPMDCTDCWQEYEYHVYEDKVIVKDPSEVIFSGSWQDFHDFCLAPVDAE